MRFPKFKFCPTTICAFAFIAMLFVSCQQEGCTDCNATNYNAQADREDGSCLYNNEQRVAVYSVTDSLTDPFQTTFTSAYAVRLDYGACDSNTLNITNYADIKNSEGQPIVAEITVVGDSIFISNQVIEGPDENATADFIEIFESKGYFSNDSIYLELSYADRFDPYYGACWGKKE